MLDFIRQNAGSWMVKFILGAIVVVFIFWGIGSFRSSRMEVAAKVNGKKILMETYQKAYARAIEGYRRMFGGTIPEFIKTEDIKKQVLNDLINKTLIMQAAAEMGVVVSDEEVRQTILHIPAFQSQGRFSQQMYERTLKEVRLTPPVFESQVREELVMDKVKALLSAGLDVPDQEALNRYRYENQEINLEYAIIDPVSCKEEVKPTEEDLKSWYESHKESYRTKPLEKVRYLLFKKADLLKDIKINKEEIERYYQEHKDEFQVEERRKARHILIRVSSDASEEEVEKAKKKALELYDRIKKGESFSKLAKKFSQDPGSAKNGGDLGFFTKGTMVKPFDDKVFSLKEGEVSKPIRTRFGWHVIRLEKIEPAREKPLKEVKASIEAKLKAQRATQLMWDKANEAYDEIIDLGGLEVYAKRHNLKPETTDYFSQDSPPPVFGFNQEVLSSLFAMSKGELSSLTEVSQGVLVAEVLDKKPPYIPEFKDVESKVREDFVKDGARELCREKAQEILKEAREKGLAVAAKAKGVEIRETGFFKRIDRTAGGKLPMQVADEARTLYKEKPYPKDVVQADGKFYVLSFKQAKDADIKGFEKAKKGLKDRIMASKKRTVFQDWLDHLREKANIEVAQGI